LYRGAYNRLVASITKAVFFDVDFTLIYPGPTFQGEGYRRSCERYGIAVDEARYAEAVRGALASLDHEQHVYDDEIFIRYTRRIIAGMGGSGEQVEACAREMYVQWAACHHFHLYDDVEAVMRELSARQVKVGLISNSHRSLDEFVEHFRLHGLVAASVSSAEHGYLKPHPSIFEAALGQAGVDARDALMVGDSLAHDVEGARRVGMRGVLLHRADEPPPELDVPVIRNLLELPALL
jgi:HAD superfamily hydrolase (TIGR01662 family)